MESSPPPSHNFCAQTFTHQIATTIPPSAALRHPRKRGWQHSRDEYSIRLSSISFPGPALWTVRALGAVETAGTSWTLETGFGPGWLSDNLSGRWVFFTNVPLALITVLITREFVPELRQEAAGPGLDLQGAGASTLGLEGVTLDLVEWARAGTQSPRAHRALGTFAAGAGAEAHGVAD